MSDEEDSHLADGAHGGQFGVPLGYGDKNRAFLQAFVSRGSLTFEEGQQILAAILGAANPDRDPVLPSKITRDVFNKYVHTAHEVLLSLDLDIRSALHQKTRERVWAIINIESDPATQLATVHTPEEITYINRLLDLMFDTHNTPRMEVMAVDETQALKVARPSRQPRESNANGGDEPQQTQGGDKGLRASDVLTLLENLVAEGWLEKSRARFYSLSPRSLLELKTWLVETYNDEGEGGADDENRWQPIKSCEFCKEIVTVGQRCDERDCVTRLHNICQDAYWDARHEKKCPRCDKEWSGKHYVGERAVTGTEAYGRAHRKSQGRSRRNQDDAAEEEEDQENGEEEMEE